MTNDRNAFKAGLFIILSIVLIILVVVGIKGITRLLEPYQMRTAYFKLTDDVSGLQVGDDVRVGGLKVGFVRSLDVEQPMDSQQPRVAVTFQMPKRLVLRVGTRIAVQGTLTGASWLNIESMGSGSPLGPKAALMGSPGAYAQVFTALGQVAPELRDLVRDVRTTTVPRANAALVTFKNTGLRRRGDGAGCAISSAIPRPTSARPSRISTAPQERSRTSSPESWTKPMGFSRNCKAVSTRSIPPWTM